MVSDSFYENFVRALTAKYPLRAELANKLLDILPISKEAVYRRLRNEVAFTVQEISVISDKLGISLDGITGYTSTRSRPFFLKLTRYAQPEEIDYMMISEYIGLLKEIADDPRTEFGSAVKMIPDTLHMQFTHLARFYLFKCMYQYNRNESRQFKDVRGTERLLSLLNEMVDLQLSIRKTFYIFDKRCVKNIVDDILYFRDIGMIDAEGIKELKNDLIEFVDHLSFLAQCGENIRGNKVDIYISNINFETGFSYIDSFKYKLSMVRAFTLYDISSLDEYTLESAKKWMESLIRASTLISVSGETQRKLFINKQKEYIEQLTV